MTDTLIELFEKARNRAAYAGDEPWEVAWDEAIAIVRRSEISDNEVEKVGRIIAPASYEFRDKWWNRKGAPHGGKARANDESIERAEKKAKLILAALKRESGKEQKYKCSNPHCGAIYLYDVKGHCPACKEEHGTGYSCYPITSIEGQK